MRFQFRITSVTFAVYNTLEQVASGCGHALNVFHLDGNEVHTPLETVMSSLTESKVLDGYSVLHFESHYAILKFDKRLSS